MSTQMLWHLDWTGSPETIRMQVAPIECILIISTFNSNQGVTLQVVLTPTIQHAEKFPALNRVRIMIYTKSYTFVRFVVHSR